MKNKLNFLIVMAIMVFVIGCSCGKLTELGSGDPSANKTTKTGSDSKSDSESNKTLADKATDVVTEGEKIGIPECDELMDYFRNKIESENTDIFTKAILKTFEARFREELKKSLDQNKSDREGTAKFCKEFKKQLDDQEAKQKK